MAQNPNWSGVFPAITTQLREDRSLDLAATARHAEALVASGVGGIVACGSLGENQSMTPDEKQEVLAAIVRAAGGKVPVLGGVAESSTAAAVRCVRDYAKNGASGVMIMPPMVYRPDEAEAFAYFKAAATAADLPWMLYNNPIAYTVDVTPAKLEGYLEIPNLVAMKESSGDPRRITEIRLLVGDRLAMFAGVDDLIMECALNGIDGWVAGSGIAFPAENQRLWDLTRAGKWDEAKALYRWFAPLMKLDTHPKFVQYIKLLVQEAGLGAEWVRGPRQTLSGEERERILAVIRKGVETRPKG
ncbi:4-hydroxy-tetrahydrodipicolinate synthase [Aquisphaera giovannonii]|uniref:4-hydroxy-tetrahydrodipicolinate synthase n=1 Tax=Aquisphaera giovannonii TaxID=406548 RepID=A0A5B9W4J8_9BACT|nr:dihydrodipicolinate synthase family protein [Aquisphaera giovannonii]QEH35139.1 4-hydroxy-tetrahydrodipicolinate synthase [Aquisphaera giovannonii]